MYIKHLTETLSVPSKASRHIPYDFSQNLARAYCLMEEHSGADGRAHGSGNPFRPKCHVLSALGFDHDSGLGLGAGVA